MKTGLRNKVALAFLIAALLIFAFAALMLIRLIKQATAPEPDPHEGQVYLYDGFDWIWMTPLEGVPVNEMTAEMFRSEKIYLIREGY